MQNQSKVKEFILQGFSDTPELQIPLFCLFLLIYLLTLLGNIIILTVVSLNPPLHSPMYFFLCNLSIIDLTYSTVTQPKLLNMLVTHENSISFVSCMIQLHCFMFLTCTEFVSLTAMAYDRYIAICNPLRYSILMNRRECVLLTILCWIVGFLDPLSHTVVISQLPFCKSNMINHFFCDFSVLIILSCDDTSFIEILTYVVGSLVALPAFILVIISYFFIISTVLQIHSSKGRQKTFSTCASHLTVVILFYGTILITYMRPPSKYISAQSKPFSVLYTVLIPLVNPFIYSLRNNDVKKILLKMIVQHS